MHRNLRAEMVKKIKLFVNWHQILESPKKRSETKLMEVRILLCQKLKL